MDHRTEEPNDPKDDDMVKHIYRNLPHVPYNEMSHLIRLMGIILHRCDPPEASILSSNVWPRISEDDQKFVSEYRQRKTVSSYVWMCCGSDNYNHRGMIASRCTKLKNKEPVGMQYSLISRTAREIAHRIYILHLLDNRKYIVQLHTFLHHTYSTMSMDEKAKMELCRKYCVYTITDGVLEVMWTCCFSTNVEHKVGCRFLPGNQESMVHYIETLLNTTDSIEHT